MSLVAYAIRTCLLAVLDGTTLAKGRVHDSAVTPIDDMATAGAEPFLVVSTEDESFDVDGWQFLDAERELDIVIEAAVGGLVRFRPEGADDDTLAVEIPHTDAGMESSLNFIGRQIFRQMLDGGAWSDLLREFAFRPKKISVKRGGKAESGTRFAARQYVITTDTIAEPMFGEEPEGAFADLLEMMAEDERFAGDVPVIRALIVGEPLPDWERARIDLGLTYKSLHSLGLGPLFHEEGEPLAQRITIKQPDRVTVVQAEPAP